MLPLAHARRGKSVSEPLLIKGEIVEALLAARGNISATAKALEVPRAYIQNKIDSDPELKCVADDLKAEVLDKAEDNIFSAVMNGDKDQSQFVVRHLGKDRGWTTRQESTGKDGKPMEIEGINVNFVSAEKPQEPNP